MANDIKVEYDQTIVVRKKELLKLLFNYLKLLTFRLGYGSQYSHLNRV